MIPESPYHNPFHIGADGDRDEVLLNFASTGTPKNSALYALARRELPFRILGCWCAREKCHGDIVAGYVNWRETMESPTQLT